MIAPKAMSVPTFPIVEPRPSVKAAKVSARGTPATAARTADPRVSARKGCILRHTISTMIAMMPTTAAAMSCTSLSACVTVPAAGKANAIVVSRLCR